MLIKMWHRESLEIRKLLHRERRNTEQRMSFSLRLRDAPLGAIALFAIACGVFLVPVVGSFGGRTTATRALVILVLLFAPAILGGVYSLFFEKSKVYGSLDLVVAAVVLLVQPFTWQWFNAYLPFAFVFTVFCALVRKLERRQKR
ncbi:MAG TPA: hypothetical protein VN950_21180 [Terriglobales bacterium]|jgi:hypothetical protein|nr:hypothetical protein [Terriglobales bacterium]